MNNRESIKNTLDEMEIIYKMDTTVIDNEYTIDTYLINLSVDNNIINGGILDGGAYDDKHISILFFFNSNTYKNINSKKEQFKKINLLNQICKYGNFYIDDENDLVYSLAIPAIGSEYINKNVFKFYFNSVISIIKDVAKDIINE